MPHPFLRGALQGQGPEFPDLHHPESSLPNLPPACLVPAVLSGHPQGMCGQVWRPLWLPSPVSTHCQRNLLKPKADMSLPCSILPVAPSHPQKKKSKFLNMDDLVAACVSGPHPSSPTVPPHPTLHLSHSELSALKCTRAFFAHMAPQAWNPIPQNGLPTPTHTLPLAG